MANFELLNDWLINGYSYEIDTLIDGGRHFSKISAVNRWLDNQPGWRDNDLVLVMDAYGGFNQHASTPEELAAYKDGDAWFQLPLEVLIERFHAVNKKANQDLSKRLGNAFGSETIRQNVIFGAGKRCTPSNVSSAACYPVPDSPLPKDMYGPETEAYPHLNYTMERQRYLSSSFIMGSVLHMRRLFNRANQRIKNVTVDDPAIMKGSDQAIFQRIFGEQEYQREVMRRKYGGGPRDPVWIEGVQIKNSLDPLFPHDELKQYDHKTNDYGIGIDYYADLSQQITDDSEDDAQWLIYRRNIDQQLLGKPRQTTSCTPQVSGLLPLEILNATALPRAAVSDASQFSPLHGWDEIPLYTNICLDTIPAVVTHSGNQKERERDWPEMWLQPHGRRLIDEILARGEEEIGTRGGAWTHKNRYLSWGELCPVGVERELYRDYWDPEEN